MKRIYLIIAILVAATYQQTNAQGCVAIKGTAGICSVLLMRELVTESNNRYFQILQTFCWQGRTKTKRRRRQ
jgi:hypothetical protein